MKKIRSMTASSNQIAAANNEPLEQSVNCEVKQVKDTKSFSTKVKTKRVKQPKQ